MPSVIYSPATAQPVRHTRFQNGRPRRWIIKKKKNPQKSKYIFFLKFSKMSESNQLGPDDDCTFHLYLNKFNLLVFEHLRSIWLFIWPGENSTRPAVAPKKKKDTRGWGQSFNPLVVHPCPPPPSAPTQASADLLTWGSVASSPL